MCLPSKSTIQSASNFHDSREDRALNCRVVPAGCLQSGPLHAAHEANHAKASMRRAECVTTADQLQHFRHRQPERAWAVVRAAARRRCLKSLQSSMRPRWPGLWRIPEQLPTSSLHSARSCLPQWTRRTCALSRSLPSAGCKMTFV